LAITLKDLYTKLTLDDRSSTYFFSCN